MRVTKEWVEDYEARRLRQCSVPQPPVRHEPLAAGQAPQGDPRQRRVSVVSYRCRLIDPDNLCPKFHIDGLRYVGAIDDDTARHITLSVSQVKVGSKAEERTEIEII